MEIIAVHAEHIGLFVHQNRNKNKDATIIRTK